MRSSIATSAACLLPFLASVSAVNPIEVKGSNFVDSETSDRFVIVGVDYQPGGQGAYGSTNSQDPLSNGTACVRDAALMQKLGVNTIRSYNVDPTLNHDECASIFNSVGIYMILDVNSPLSGQSINRGDPWSSYYTSYLEHTFAVVEAFKNYPNTLGFFAGNEVINDVPSASNGNPQVIRAVIRDLKNYIKNNSKRQIPVGYSAADVRDILQDTWAYFQCALDGDESDMSRSDFFGLNSYSWCGGDATFKSSGYNDLAAMFANTATPVFYSEYGCNAVSPRVFDEVQALYGPEMTTLSGGLVYEYSQEDSNYGLVDIYSNGTLQLRSDYNSLQKQFNKLNMTLLEAHNSTATSKNPPTCAKDLISGDGFVTEWNIPTPPPGANEVISSGISNAPTGTIVSVTQTSVKSSVYGTDGSEIKDLVIKATNGSNEPRGDETEDITSSAASSSGKTSSIVTKTQSASATASSDATASSAATGAANALTGVSAPGVLVLAVGAVVFAL
ncbi:Glucanosyltransferase-domain-containing protein [Delphinella strobiligena]|nr:Glucanosyltransferase-domain-containing protein [Delphinella strobiligena]